MTTPEAPNNTIPEGPDASAPRDDTIPIPTDPAPRDDTITPLVNESNGNIPMKSCKCQRCGASWFERRDGKDGSQGPLCPLCKHLAGVTAPEREALARAQARCKEAAADLRAAAQAVREQPQGVGLSSLGDVEAALQRVERVVALYEFFAKLLDGSLDDTIREGIASTVPHRQAFVGQIEAGVESGEAQVVGLGGLVLAICRQDYDDAFVRLLNGGPI